MERDSLYILEEEEEGEEEVGKLVGYPTGLTACSPLHLLARSGDAAAIRGFLQACDPQGFNKMQVIQCEAKTTFNRVFRGSCRQNNMQEKNEIFFGRMVKRY